MTHALKVAAAFGAALALLGLPGMETASAAQPPAPPSPPPSPRAAAPVDLTGQWVSVISEDWRWRMVTPLKGDFANIPVNAAARAVGEQWDPGRDEAEGMQCKGYGVLAIMREPGRFRISWQDDFTLKIETDSGMQTRLLHFTGAVPAGEPQLQGYSRAMWQPPPGGPAGFGGIGVIRASRKSNTLEVATTRILPGYLRKNGIPFSEDAKLTEYFDVVREPGGQEWIVITSIVEDPRYLNGPWVTSINLKKELDVDRAKWHPTPCSAR